MTLESSRAIRYLISGRVQGVGFRWFVRNAAEQVGIVGIVRNLPDGKVEAIGVGTTEDLERFKAFLFRGPSYSQVTNVKEEELSDSLQFSSFEITY